MDKEGRFCAIMLPHLRAKHDLAERTMDGLEIIYEELVFTDSLKDYLGHLAEHIMFYSRYLQRVSLFMFIVL